MILFETYHIETYNHIIHNFLEIEVFNGDTDIGDIIDELLPQYLYREQYSKCVKTLEELFQWTEDSFYHQMTSLHELLAYEFIEHMSGLQEDLDEFDQIYFDEKSHLLIEQAAQVDFIEGQRDANGITLEEYTEYFYDVSSYVDSLFGETDFLLIPMIYNQRTTGNTLIEERLGINIDFYFDLLPLDIQRQYQTKHITLTGEISSMLKYIENRIRHGSLYKLFWENNIPVKEERIQLILENIMDAYFYNQKVEITREALLGNGKVDFKLYKDDHEDEKVLIEIKRGSSSYLKKGYEKQLTEYMQSTNYKNAFYLIACFTDSEYERSIQFIRNHVYTDTIQLYINISILDLRKRKTASVL